MADTIHDPSKLSDKELLKIAAQSIEPYESCGIGIDEYEPETECAVEAYGSELVAFARAAIAADRARAALAQPEPEGPTPSYEEMRDLAAHCVKGGKSVEWVILQSLARWGRPTSPPQPVPVSERLPGPEDCDAEGRCWLGGEQFAPGDSTWILGFPAWAERFPEIHRYWLPAHALPLPVEVEG